MGLAYHAATYIADLISKGVVQAGASLTFGRPYVLFNETGWDLLLQRFDLGKVQDGKVTMASTKAQARIDKLADLGVLWNGVAPSPDAIYYSLGFEEVHYLDVSSYEGADIIWDLNEKIEDPKYCGKFDLVHDAGTMEHVFNVGIVLQNIHALLKENGVSLHENPMNGWIDHGFYQFSPTFYYDYYASNKYDVLNAITYWADAKDFPMGLTFASVPLGAFSMISDGRVPGHDNKTEHFHLRDGKYNIYNILFAAKKRSDSTSGVVPVQGFWQKSGIWGDADKA